MRRAQSSVEPMLCLTALVVAVLIWASLRPEAAYGIVVTVAEWLETKPAFQAWIAFMEGR